MQFVAGFDGGGTKTAVEIRTINNIVKTRSDFGALNINGSSIETVQNTLENAFSFLNTQCGGLQNLACVCIGTAGISNPKTQQIIEETVRLCGFNGEIILKGDHETALAGAIGKQEGVILIAGTGSICFGRTASGETARCGGFGHVLDDGGSGYAIGKNALVAVVRSHDKREKPTVLTKLVYEQLGLLNINELIKFVHDEKTDKKSIASIAPLVSTAYDMGDFAAREIVKNACKELAQIAQPVIDELNFERTEIAMAGSILKKAQEVYSGVKQMISAKNENVKFITPVGDAASGACIIALDKTR